MKIAPPKWRAGCIYKVHKREWKDYCDFVEIEYQKLISHSVTRWLSLYPSLPRMLPMYPASHSYFMSIDRPTVVLKRFFGNSLNELCLQWKSRSMKTIPTTHWKRFGNSVIETFAICRLYRFHWPWFSLYGYLALPLFVYRTLFKTLRHLQSFLVALMRKFWILKSPKHHLLRLYRVSPLWRQGFNRDNQMYISSQVKAVLRKLRDWEKARIVTVH